MARLPDLNEDGTVVVVKLLSMRHHSPDDGDYDNIEEAKQAAEWMVEYNSAAPVAIILDGDLKLYNRYEGLMYEWVIPDAEEAAFVKKHWPQFFHPKVIENG